MKLVKVLNAIKELNVSAFRTNDVATLLNLSTSYASKVCARLKEAGHLILLKKGLWGMPDKLDPLSLPNYLLAPLPGYVSFYSALYYRNVIDQIPSVIYVATLHKTKKFITPIATVSAHQIQPEFFFGYTYDEKTGVKMATAEKALIDTLYLSTAKSNLFKRLPEIDKDELNPQKAQKLIDQIPSPRRRVIVQRAFERVSSNSFHRE